MHMLRRCGFIVKFYFFCGFVVQQVKKHVKISEV